MEVLKRVSRQMSADIDRLLEQVEDKELTIFQLICDMEECIVDLRRETVATLARQNRLRKQLFSVDEIARNVEARASLAFHAGDERRARHILGRGIGTLKRRDALDGELAEAGEEASRLVAALVRMEDRAHAARRTRDHLVRRRRVREGRERAGSSDELHALAACADTVVALDLEAQKDREGPSRSRRAGAGRVARPLEGGEGC